VMISDGLALFLKLVDARRLGFSEVAFFDIWDVKNGYFDFHAKI